MGIPFNERSRRDERLAGPFPEEWLAYLQDNVILYRLLSESEQAKLRGAVRIFIAEKFWEGCAGLEISDEMRVTVAGQACLLILGFDDYCFEELRTVLLYPGGYLGVEHDPLGREDQLTPLHGQAHHQGPVILSWWQARWDGRRLGHCNLVIHEFAHKLAELGDPSIGMPPIDDPMLAKRWKKVTDREYRRLVADAERDRPSLLDHYGATNQAEFFAVATECFFLQPTEFREQHKALYELFAQWYRQDPAQRPIDKTIVAKADEANEEYGRHAIAECNALIRHRPDDVDAYRERAEWHHELGEFENAVVDWTAVIRLTEGEEQADAYCERAAIYYSMESYDLAIEDFNDALRRVPDLAEAHAGRGSAQAKRGEYDSAIADLSEAIRISPDYVEAYEERAAVYEARGELDKARRDRDKASRKDAKTQRNEGRNRDGS